MAQFILSSLPRRCVLEAGLEGKPDLVPIVFVCGGKSRVVLCDDPGGPALDPVLDIRTFDEAQQEGCPLHWVEHLLCINVLLNS
jgi:hypothetical protein